MKKIFLVLFGLLVLSCSSDSSDAPIENPIIGKWFEHKKVNYKSDGSIHSEFLNSSEPCYGMTTYEYKSNGQFIKDSYDYIDSECSQNPIRTGAWSTNNNILTIEVNNSSENSNIDFVDNEKLLLKKNNPGGTQYQYSIVEFKKTN